MGITRSRKSNCRQWPIEKEQKGQTMADKTLHRKLKIKQHPTKTEGVPEEQELPTDPMASALLRR